MSLGVIQALTIRAGEYYDPGGGPKFVPGKLW
jgi:hypothetical protein